MRRRIIVVLAAFFLIGLVPGAQAGPGSAICKAGSNGYELATGEDAPWSCPQ